MRLTKPLIRKALFVKLILLTKLKFKLKVFDNLRPTVFLKFANEASEIQLSNFRKLFKSSFRMS